MANTPATRKTKFSYYEKTSTVPNNFILFWIFIFFLMVCHPDGDTLFFKLLNEMHLTNILYCHWCLSSEFYFHVPFSFLIVLYTYTRTLKSYFVLCKNFLFNNNNVVKLYCLSLSLILRNRMLNGWKSVDEQTSRHGYIIQKMCTNCYLGWTL